MTRLLAKRQYKPKRCESCGETYTPTGANQKWCGPACNPLDEASGLTPAAEPAPALDPGLYDRVKEAISANEAEIAHIKRGWRSSAWGFAASLRDHPALVAQDADAAADVLDPYLEAIFPAEEWDHEGPVPGPWVRNLGDHDSKGKPMDPLENFLEIWPRVFAPALQVALGRADAAEYQRPLAFGPDLQAPRRAPFRRFLAVCRECCRVSEVRGDGGVAPLPVKALADALGSDRRTVGGWRREAIRRGFLVEVEEATPHGGPRARAAEFRWVAEERARRTFEPQPARPARRAARPARNQPEEPGF